MREQIEAALANIRPALQADGGDIELVEVVGNSAVVRLVGACVGCPMAQMTLRAGVEEYLRSQVPGFDRLIPEGQAPGPTRPGW